jgi:hypothetical protein
MNKIEIITSIIAACATVLTGVYFIVYKLVSAGMNKEKVQRMESNVNAYESRRETCNERFRDHEKTIDDTKRDLSYLREKVDGIHDVVSEISVWIMGKDKGMVPKLAAKQSPRELTKSGIGLLNISGGKNCIDGNLAFFISKIDEKKPPTPLDVEDGALNVILKNTGNGMFNDIKNYIYYAPGKETIEGMEIEISMFPIAFVMSLYLRDKYLDLHPELSNH